MAGKVILVGTLDTKGQEFKFIKELIEGTGVKTVVVDAGVKGKPPFPPDIANDRVAAAGGTPLDELLRKDDRGLAMEVMTKGAANILTELYNKGEVAGVISLGGSAGTTIGTAAMRALPVGVPKVMVSTMASGDTRPYVGVKDITMMYSVVDISGINSLSRRILANAAFAVAGMAGGELPAGAQDKPLIAATMFGVTTPCVTKAKEYLEAQGYELLVFHATGTGGQAMEGLVDGGFMKGVLDITTTEWADELAGGVLSAGPHRLEAAGKNGLPQVVSVGALDMVNFGPPDTIPAKYKDRLFYQHNPTVTLMRTTAEECRKLGEIIAAKLNAAQGPVALFLPLKGVSLIDTAGKPFFDPEADAALFDALRTNIDRAKVELIEMDNDINDDEFALAMAAKLQSYLEK
ncbi:Tm-1-like ATP-binding domain-containing protein [Anaeroselena agilis]|uniref:Tm-1-like ATP-binding domain-containing protein n=1 Tax=Anaeroselena agilis TaxID=3063788 RepID=A0ABU3NVK5_9FIRM|nr:Tm-1-like ATP-binding domain-containing protein [Selenomonadales bacterium 4137-cl]